MKTVYLSLGSNIGDREQQLRDATPWGAVPHTFALSDLPEAIGAGPLTVPGAITGIHDVLPGEVARVEFKGLGAIQCVATPLKPRI